MCGHRRALLRRRGRLLSDATGASRRAAVHVRQLREEGHSRTAPYHRDPAHETEQWTITSSRDGTGLCLERALDTQTGAMSSTLVNREDVFVLFGSCIPL